MVQNVELLVCWNHVSDPRDMMGSDFNIMQGRQESYFPEVCIDKSVLRVANVNGQNGHHVI